MQTLKRHRPMFDAAHILAVAVDPEVVEQVRDGLGLDSPVVSEVPTLSEGLARVATAMPTVILLSPPPDGPAADALKVFHERYEVRVRSVR